MTETATDTAAPEAAPSFAELAQRIFGTTVPPCSPPDFLRQPPSIIAAFDADLAALSERADAGFFAREHRGDPAMWDRVFARPRVMVPAAADSAPGQGEDKTAAVSESAQVTGPGQKDIAEDSDPAADEHEQASRADLERWTRRAPVAEHAPALDADGVTVMPAAVPAGESEAVEADPAATAVIPVADDDTEGAES